VELTPVPELRIGSSREAGNGIHRLCPDDWGVWRDLRLSALTDAPEAFGSTLADWKDADEQRWRRRLEEVPFNAVAVVDGTPVGQVSAASPDGGGCVDVTSFWVAPHARGTGTADALVRAVADWAWGSGAVALQLSVRATNERAIKFYERVGFATSGEPGDEPREISMSLSLVP
jgi:ribosomal protein S18 acetylase RimI-like enzyme